MRVTIRDVAKAAEVSISTVSRALKNQRGLSDDTRRMIRRVARDIGYDPARLRSTKARRLVFMVHRQHSHFETNPFFSDVLRGVEEACLTFDMVPTLLSCGAIDPIREQLRVHQPDAILVAGFFETEVLDLVAGLELPTALIYFSLRDMPSVNPDNTTGGHLAARHLLDIGRRRIAYIAGSLAHASILERAGGYRRALFEAGVLADPQLEIIAPRGIPHDRGASVAMQQLLRLREPPDAVFAYNDSAAIAAIETCLAAGLRVPQDIAVVGFDDIRAAATNQPALTTLRVDRPALGRLGVELALRSDAMPRLITLPVELVVRASTVA